MAAYELSHGFTKPNLNLPEKITKDAVHSLQTRNVKRELIRVLRSKSLHTCPTASEHMMVIYVKHANEKRVKWSSPRIILKVDNDTGTVTVPESKKKTICAAPEDICPDIAEDCFAQMAKDGNGALDATIETIDIDENDERVHSDPPILRKKLNAFIDDTETTQILNDSSDKTSFDGCYSSDDPLMKTNTEQIPAPEDSESHYSQVVPNVGDKINVYWPFENMPYPGFIAKERNNSNTTDYDNGGIETHNSENET